MRLYEPATLEPMVQAYWGKNRCFNVTEDPQKQKFYCLSMIPYPSGQLHMGHVRNYTLSDVIARFERMQGKNVLHPMGWDAFGLPAENAAIKHGTSPADWTRQNIATMRTQLTRLGLGYDWDREITTNDPNYYRWEQWLFLKMYQQGLVYRKSTLVNWDPVDKTVLANEQVVDGRGWRSGALVEQREIPQWFLKITAYADELLEGLKTLTGWPEKVRTMQENWIGRSTGIEIDFSVENTGEKITIFTTRPDTLYGVTFLALSPQHPIVENLSKNNPTLAEFIKKISHTKMAEADLVMAEKHGMPLGINVIHPMTKEKIPLWVANFVLMQYGAGAVMGVPSDDARDHEFATKYQLPIREVFVDNKLINSDFLNGLSPQEGIKKSMQYLVENRMGEKKVHYRLRDWGISRQRYWGAPIPMIYCDACGVVPVPEKDLPVVLPHLTPKGEGSVLQHTLEFLNTPCPHCGATARRETDTFDTFMESSWYYDRLACVDQKSAVLDQRVNYWLPVDRYVGGVEHAVMHLLYARFIHKVLRDLKLVSCDEPFTNLLTQGMVIKDGAKMSKSKGNVVEPNPLIEKYGADTVRLFSLFAAPPEQSLEWQESGVEGASRYLNRLWVLCDRDWSSIPRSETHANTPLRCTIHRTIQKVTHDMGTRLTFNTAIAALMELTTALKEASQETDADKALFREGIEALVRMLSPIVPHLTQVLWEKLGYNNALIDAPWPIVDKSALVQASVQLIVQVNGKKRAEITVPRDSDTTFIEKAALADPTVQRFIQGNAVKKVIVVPGRLVSIVL